MSRGPVIDKILKLENINIFIKAEAQNLKQGECVKNKGLWNYENDKCFKYYVFYIFLNIKLNTDPPYVMYCVKSGQSRAICGL